MKNKAKRLLDEIEYEAKCTATFTGRKTFSQAVMDAIREVAREKFVPVASRLYAYENRPLTIGHGQTISQPYIVALMTDLLDLTSDSIVLEVGTGSGYQAAILSKIARKVYSIETIGPLFESASKRLLKLGYTNIETHQCNGYEGWEEKAPFDAIIVTAAATHIPQALVDQLKPGGRMVIPVGLPYMSQELMLLTKNNEGQTRVKSVLSVAFVPLVDDKEPNKNKDNLEQR